MQRSSHRIKVEKFRTKYHRELLKRSQARKPGVVPSMLPNSAKRVAR